VTVQIGIGEAGKWFRSIGQQIPTVAVNGLHSAALRILSDVQNDDRAPKDKGIYRAGWRVVREADGATIYNATTQSIFIEHGVRAENVKIGRKMITALAEWAKRHGIGSTVRASTGGSRGRGRAGVFARGSVKNFESIAWAIAKNIQKRGLFNSEWEARTGKRRGVLGYWLKKNAARYIREEVSAELLRFMRGDR